MAKSYKNKKNRATRKFKGGCGGTCPILKGGAKKKKIGSKKKRGGNATILSLAYPQSTYSYPPNPYLAYTGNGQSYPRIKGGYNRYSNPNIGPPNTQLANAYPNPGPTPTGFGFLNPIQNGGNLKYPNGLTGETWRWDPNSWPGVKPIDSNGNHYSLNTYDNDVSRQMIDVGANKPFLGFWGVKGGSSRKKSKTQRGGDFSNFITQDIINLGRQYTHGLASTFNGLNGTRATDCKIPFT
jgi:hypothetical protein